MLIADRIGAMLIPIVQKSCFYDKLENLVCWNNIKFPILFKKLYFNTIRKFQWLDNRGSEYYDTGQLYIKVSNKPKYMTKI